MIDFSSELFIDEFTETATVPVRWQDSDSWDDDDDLSATADVDCIFDNFFEDVQLGTAGALSSNPTAFFKTTDIPTPTEGDTITINSTAYTVGTPQPDGQGITVIDLQESS